MPSSATLESALASCRPSSPDSPAQPTHSAPSARSPRAPPGSPGGPPNTGRTLPRPPRDHSPPRKTCPPSPTKTSKMLAPPSYGPLSPKPGLSTTRPAAG